MLFCFSVRSVMHKYMEKKNEVNFDKIFNQVLGEYVLFFTENLLTRNIIILTTRQTYNGKGNLN